ncbi:MAG TPA: hypothetical protein VLQ48_16080, partial [Chloroflexia bacterium]|nr:hypothetical protein [Chloroflexia bacterium]
MTKYSSRIIWAFFAILAIVAVWSVRSLAGGIEMRAFQQPIRNGDPAKLKTPILAQSFVSTRDNLSRVEIQLAEPFVTPIPPDMGIMLIKGEGLGGAPLYATRLDASQIITDSGVSSLSFAFPPIANSAGVTYTFALQTTGYSVNSILQPAYSPIDALSSGTMYTEDGPQPGDLTIATYYHYDLAWLLGDTWNAIGSNLFDILAWLALFLLPGMALLLWLPNGLNMGQKLMAAPGLSALCVPLMYLLASLAGIPVGPNKLWALLAVCAAAIAVQGARYMLNRANRTKDELQRTTSNLRPTTYDLQFIAFWASFVLVMVVTIATRLISLRDIPAGEGIDAYHHTLITALFLRDAGIPAGYAPFAPFASFTYHFGFHSLSATIAWLTGSTGITNLMPLVPRVGQIVSCVLPIPSLVLFGWRVRGNRWVGLTAGAFAGLLSVVPAFYGEWSRYTQGLGLAVLPVAWVLFIETISRMPGDQQRVTPDLRSKIYDLGPRIVLAVLGAAGMFLTHYRIAIIYVVLVGLYVAWCILVQWKRMRSAQATPIPLSKYISRITPYLLSTALVGLLTVVVLLPWLLNLRSNFVTNFIDKSGQNLDAYFATAERLGPAILSHPSLVRLALLSALGLAILGWRTWRSRGWGVLLGMIAGLPIVWSGLTIYFSHDPIALETDTRTTLLGLSPVTWLLLLEILLLAVMVVGHASYVTRRAPADDENVHTSQLTERVLSPSSHQQETLVILPALAWLILELWA